MQVTTAAAVEVMVMDYIMPGGLKHSKDATLSYTYITRVAAVPDPVLQKKSRNIAALM